MRAQAGAQLERASEAQEKSTAGACTVDKRAIHRLEILGWQPIISSRTVAAELQLCLKIIMPFRKSPRLSTSQYRGAHAYSVTIVTARRRPVFRDSVLVGACVHRLGVSAWKYGFTTHAYCFMPDHVDLLLTGDEWSSLPDFARHFKQLTGYAYSRKSGRKLWQTSYWDHALRAEEDIEDVARYVWGNRVRAGIVADYRAYSGSGPRPLPELI